MDCMSAEQRSKNMKAIKSHDTKIEVILRKALWAKGIRYRKNFKVCSCKPDIVLTKYKIAIFCDSEFFHGKDWEILKPQLERGKNADFCDSRVEDLGELRAIEGDAKFASCPLVSLNKLKTIGGNANFRFSQVSDLSKLKSIYGSADFRGCTIYNFGRLKLINGDVYISDLSELFPVSINVDLKNVVVKGETYVEKV